MKSILVFCFLALVSLTSAAQSTSSSKKDGPADSLPRYQFRLADPVTLPIGKAGSPIGGHFGCTEDGSVFLQVITPPEMPRTASSYRGGITLFAVKSPTDIVSFDPNLAPGYKAISPIIRYFVTDTQVFGFAHGTGMDHGDLSVGPDSKNSSPVLLIFDRKGALQSTVPLDTSLNIEQIAAYESGDLLLVAWDDLRKKTFLNVTDKTGTLKREIRLQENDPGDAESQLSLVGVQIHPYGKNLLLVPNDLSKPILEVNESGVVNTHTLHIPKGYVGGFPISLSRRSWKIFMLPDVTEEKPAASTSPDQESKPPAKDSWSVQPTQGVMMEFNPEDGSVQRQIELPSSGYQPACENNGEYTFLSAHAGDGKLQLVKATVLE